VTGFGSAFCRLFSSYERRAMTATVYEPDKDSLAQNAGAALAC